MSRAFWDEVAEDYDERILNVFDHDRQGLVRRCIAAAAAEWPGGRAVDLGCGTGKFTALLASSFAEVEACDFSEKALAVARGRCSEGSVRFWNVDLSLDPMPFDPAEFAICINVLIMPRLDERLRAWRAATNQVVSGGLLAVVVPSLESLQLSFYRELQSCLESGDDCEAALRVSLDERSLAADLQQGVRRLGSQLVKHYVRQELEAMLSDHSFEAIEVEPLTYPPGLSGVPNGAWDWLACARRR